PASAASADAPALHALFFATPATVAAGAFEREVALRAPEVRVIPHPCEGLAAAIEAGAADRAAALVQSATAAALDEARRRGGGAPEIAVLGCTHYPLAEAAFRDALPSSVTLLNQPAVVAASLARYLQRRPAYERRDGPARGPRLRCLTSGDPARVAPLASAFFGAALDFERS
ncbi:MAG: glutamate racemase, partial [Pseudomonadota bacterium]